MNRPESLLLIAAMLVAACSERTPPASPEHLPAGLAVESETERANIEDMLPDALRFKRTAIPEGENAYPLLMQACESFVGQEDRDLGRALFTLASFERSATVEPQMRARVQEWIAANAESLALVNSALERGRCQFPETQSPEDTPWFVPVSRLSAMKAFGAKAFAERGDHGAAVAEITGIVRLGEMILGDGVPSIDAMVADAIETRGLRGSRWLASRQGIDESDLEHLLGEVAVAAMPYARFADSLRLDFLVCYRPAAKEALAEPGVYATLGDFLSETPATLRPGLWPDKDKLLVLHGCPVDFRTYNGVYASYYVRRVVSAEGRWKDRDRTIWADLGERRQRRLDALVRRNEELAARGVPFEALPEQEKKELVREVSEFMGVVIAAMGVIPMTEGVAMVPVRGCAAREMTRTIIAIRLYELRHGALPPDLQALVDDGILEAVPIDPFSDEPLRYSRERRVVWSVGPNETDEGGAVGPEDKPGSWSGDDFVLRVPGAATPSTHP